MQNNLIKLHVIFVFTLIQFTASAQGDGPPPPGLPDPPLESPINQHVPVLVAAGIMLGVIMIKKKKK